MNTPLIEARQLRVRYGSKEAVKSLDFQMGKGRVVGLLGHCRPPCWLSGPHARRALLRERERVCVCVC